MGIALPLYGQEKPKTCALACLRMVLAKFGVHVPEHTLEAQAIMEPGGTRIEELERLARLYHLSAEIHEIKLGDLHSVLSQGKLAIAYIDRAIFDLSPRLRARHSLRHAKIHTVVPTQISAGRISFHDPLGPRITRRSLKLFQQAYAKLGNHCVVCSKPP